MYACMKESVHAHTHTHTHTDFISKVTYFQGEEVYNTYGPLTNQELLHMYGFTERYPLNTNDSVSSLPVCYDITDVKT